jgi:hypothetical protein
VRVHGYTPAELLFGFVPRGIKEYRVEELCILDGLDADGYGLRLAMMDEKRERAGEKMVGAEDAVEGVSKGAWTALQEGDLVLLRKFQRSSKLKPTWEGPYRISDMAYHSRSCRLQDITTGEIVKVKKGGRRERIHVNDLKLYMKREDSQVPGQGEYIELTEWGGNDEEEWDSDESERSVELTD